MICVCCGKDQTIGTMKKGGLFKCKECPPVLLLTKTWRSEMFFDVQTSRFTPHTLPYFERCGFKLFKHTQFLKRECSKDIKELFMLRYFGNTRCKLIKGHDWPGDVEECKCIAC